MSQASFPKRILILSEHFAPAYNAGGIVRSLENLVFRLNNRYRFFVVTSNNTLNKSEVIKDVRFDTWIEFTENCKVHYISAENRTFRTLKQVIQNVQPDIIYLNGMYSAFYTLLPLCYYRVRKQKTPIVLAPWGMLQAGCLSIKRLKKRVYFRFFRILGLPTQVRWHATNEQEQSDIVQMFGPRTRVTIANAIPGRVPEAYQPIRKSSLPLRLVTISLVAHKKGHLRVIRALKDLQPEINAEYHIYGPIKDTDYWEACKREIDSLENSVKVVYHGFLDPSRVATVIQQNHFFILHSDGENFCQSIYESLAAGRPVITSDRTPWNGLEETGAGWNVKLDDITGLKATIRHAYNLDQQQYDCLCLEARAAAKHFFEEMSKDEQYDTLFQFS